MTTQRTPSAIVAPAAGPAVLARVAWRTSWQFTGLFRRSTRAAIAASKTWTWQWLVVTWQAVGVFPTCLASTTVNARHVYTACGASALVRRVDAHHPRRAAGPLLAAAGVVLVLIIAVAGLVLVAAATPGGAIAVEALMLCWVAALITAAIGAHPAGSTGLARRARQLTAGPAVVVWDVAADRPGHGAGTRLLQGLAEQWRRDGVQVAVLHAGSDDLVAFYRDKVGGWLIDPAGDGRRMVWTAGPAR